MRVVALTDSPLHTDVLEPERVADAITVARRGFDFVVVDLHPSYSALNQAIFDERRPDPRAGHAGRARPSGPPSSCATSRAELGIRDRLAMVVNRANSGVSVADMERTVGMPALALIRSGGLLFVRAANEGRTVIEMFPREKITERLRRPRRPRARDAPMAVARRSRPASGSSPARRKPPAPDA